ncbi:thiamine phosphate synthase [Amphibacillus jilinensis]|uniref:thiamine phosphate synthase n=1 Tax=Amphibacillus jilinensis TaxID=1216008 RepID=UPI0003030DCA|nr:thiamine phosphate synthase [Amphibacillus jilinensis]
MFNKACLNVYFILGSMNTPGRDPLDVLEQALLGGITCFQFREKGPGARIGLDKFHLAKEMQRLCAQYQVPFIVNDDVGLALAIDSDGVHVGQEDQSIQEIKAIAPKGMIVGVSATSVEQAVQAKQDGADYLGVGPIYRTTTKTDAKEPIGLKGISQIRAAVGTLPIVAIGGIQAEHKNEIKEAGADGVSVISAISAAEHPQEAVRSFFADNDA